MNVAAVALDVFLNIDVHLDQVIAEYGLLTYLILFLIVFCETGLVVTPFLPGDSLLFAAGAFAAKGSLHLGILFLLIALASILGDALNYHIGKFIGPRVFRSESKWIKKDYLHHTKEFYKKYGSKTIILSRFLPILRTFAPFVAGVGTMHYGTFFLYNIIGGTLWAASFLGLGYLFGNIPFVQENFSLVIVFIVLVSAAIMLRELLKHKKHTTA